MHRSRKNLLSRDNKLINTNLHARDQHLRTSVLAKMWFIAAHQNYIEKTKIASGAPQNPNYGYRVCVRAAFQVTGGGLWPEAARSPSTCSRPARCRRKGHAPLGAVSAALSRLSAQCECEQPVGSFASLGPRPTCFSSPWQRSRRRSFPPTTSLLVFATSGKIEPIKLESAYHKRWVAFYNLYNNKYLTALQNQFTGKKQNLNKFYIFHRFHWQLRFCSFIMCIRCIEFSWVFEFKLKRGQLKKKTW